MNRSIYLICGGTSSERLVSVATAQNVVGYLKNPKIYFIDEKSQWHLLDQDELVSHKEAFTKTLNPKSSHILSSLQAINAMKDGIVFIGLHGTEGEDGSLQEKLESFNIPFTGSGSKSSRLCFDKHASKQHLKNIGVNMAKEILVHFGSDSAVQSVLNFFSEHKKIVMKPVANGSSFGLHIVDSKEKLLIAIEKIKNSKEQNYLIEEFVFGREMTVGVLQSKKGIRAIVPSEVVLEQGVSFDYEGKYLGRGSQEVTPAKINSVEKKLCQDLALAAHNALGCYGYTRTDMILTQNGPYYLETNTLPGLTKASFYPQQLEAESIPFQEFLNEQLDLAFTRYV